MILKSDNNISIYQNTALHGHRDVAALVIDNIIPKDPAIILHSTDRYFIELDNNYMIISKYDILESLLREMSCNDVLNDKIKDKFPELYV